MSNSTSVLFLIVLAVAAVAVLWWAVEKRRRKMHSVAPGFRPEIELSCEEEFELYHNALSLCSMKSRLCMSELAIPYKSHHIDLIETRCYENIRPQLLDVNPGGTVPVLVHKGHPIYESHEQIRYAAAHAPASSPSLVPEDPALSEEMEAWVDRSSLTEDPINHGDESAGNAIAALTLPLFCTMIEKISFLKIAEGLLFHFDKRRPLMFMTLKVVGIERIDRMKQAMKIVSRGRKQVARHLDELEQKLTQSGGPWILGEIFSLADVGWLAIFERLVQADILHLFLADGQRPHCASYWTHLQGRPGYREAIIDHHHPIVIHGTRRLQEVKRDNTVIRVCLEGEGPL